jgi:hypothetical protein
MGHRKMARQGKPLQTNIGGRETMFNSSSPSHYSSLIPTTKPSFLPIFLNHIKITITYKPYANVYDVLQTGHALQMAGSGMRR